MKGTEHFKQAIKAYLDERAKNGRTLCSVVCQREQEFGRLRDIHTQPGNGNL